MLCKNIRKQLNLAMFVDFYFQPLRYANNWLCYRSNITSFTSRYIPFVIVTHCLHTAMKTENRQTIFENCQTTCAQTARMNRNNWSPDDKFKTHSEKTVKNHLQLLYSPSFSPFHAISPSMTPARSAFYSYAHVLSACGSTAYWFAPSPPWIIQWLGVGLCHQEASCLVASS